MIVKMISVDTHSSLLHDILIRNYVDSVSLYNNRNRGCYVYEFYFLLNRVNCLRFLLRYIECTFWQIRELLLE